MASVVSWISDHKLATVGTLWASAVGASVAFRLKGCRTRGGSRLIQALTLALLSGVVLKHYYLDSESAAAAAAAAAAGGGEVYSAQWLDLPEEGPEERWSW